MDISFTCGNCGKDLVVDEAGAGITIDCPECGKPVYVPSPAAPNPTAPSSRVEPKPKPNHTPSVFTAKPKPTPTPPPSRSEPKPAPQPAPLPAPIPTHNSLFPPNRHGQSDLHPSIAGGVTCLCIMTAMILLAVLTFRENMFLALGLGYGAIPPGTAAFLCAVYGICHGHVKHGVLIVVALSVITGLSVWLGSGLAMSGAQFSPNDLQRQQEEMLKQMQRQFQR